MSDVKDDDVEWCIKRHAELVQLGLSSVDAYETAARERADFITGIAVEHYDELMTVLMIQQRRDRENQLAAERAKHRAEIERKATPAQRPTLKTSLGDLLAAKVKR
jgi:hypothetical protein